LSWLHSESAAHARTAFQVEPAVGGRLDAELRGSSIEQGKTYRLAVGDMIPIPPNTPAQFSSDTAGGLTYMVMKVNAMLYPWDLIR
jgi:hypothetical protein